MAALVAPYMMERGSPLRMDLKDPGKRDRALEQAKLRRVNFTQNTLFLCREYQQPQLLGFALLFLIPVEPGCW